MFPLTPKIYIFVLCYVQKTSQTNSPKGIFNLVVGRFKEVPTLFESIFGFRGTEPLAWFSGRFLPPNPLDSTIQVILNQKGWFTPSLNALLSRLAILVYLFLFSFSSNAKWVPNYPIRIKVVNIYVVIDNICIRIYIIWLLFTSA